LQDISSILPPSAFPFGQARAGPYTPNQIQNGKEGPDSAIGKGKLPADSSAQKPAVKKDAIKRNRRLLRKVMGR
jgi:hypothetical protein